MAVSGNVYRSVVITAVSAIESLVSDTTKRNQMSSQYAYQAMVENTLNLKRSFNQLVCNFHIDLVILSNEKRAQHEDGLNG